MGGNTEYIPGHGYLCLGQAVHVAQNSEGGVDQRLAQFLERRLAEVWSKLNAQPHTYILPSDEFALMNYYRPRFGDNEIVRNATKRFWDNHKVLIGSRQPPYFSESSTLAFSDLQPFPSFSHDTFDLRSQRRSSPRSILLVGTPLRSKCLMYIREQRSSTKPTWPIDELKTIKMSQLSAPVAATKGSFQSLSILLMLITFAQITVAALITPASFRDLSVKPLSSWSANDASPLECLQVAPPVLSPTGGCQQTLMIHTFASSYGQPFVGK
ncbi:hypothetical protein J1614_003930 [Plenodomus biglobosus]|nr:hypothetical protein J1614_003930 [Plenodomus biglobosus]